ncbi:general secretion pathway protein N [Collimonas sp. OK607]|nr:type II secretion system protein N [Collimonas sp. OK607]SFA87599.1 general secretion pathway protein N [Collimonas sp. OK607]
MRGLSRVLMWTAAALLSVLITTAAFLPAAWLAPLVESRTGGRLTLGEAQGSLWRGSAFVGAAPSGKDAVTALLPGRFAWRLSPLVLLGRVEATLENAEVLSSAVNIRGSWSTWVISPSSLALPAERLAALGAPLNTLQPAGRMKLGWQQLTLARASSGGVDLNGVMTLDMLAMASRLSPVKPLGSYRMRFDWQGRQANLTLATLDGAMLLNGSGKLQDGHLQFSGTAEAAAGQEEKLATLLSLLGQRRQVNGRNVIGLEFKS